MKLTWLIVAAFTPLFISAQVPTSVPLAPAPLVLSPVLWAENPDVVSRFAVNSGDVENMLNAGLLKLTSSTTPAMAWKRLGITANDTVGIKITAAGGSLLATHRAVIETIVSGLRAVGVPAEKIIVWDKNQSELSSAGFNSTAGGSDHIAINSVFPGTGYDAGKFYNNELIGSLIWGDYDFVRRSDDDAAGLEQLINRHPFGSVNPLVSSSGGDNEQSSNKSYYARLETEICTKLINVPTLTDNAYVGMQGCLSSLALASVDNNRRFQGPPTFAEIAIPEILSQNFIRGKVVLHILDALVPQYAGGPAPNPLYCQPIGALYLSRDPVAIDSLVLPRLEKWRVANHIDPIGKTARHIHTSASYGLGTDDPHRIQLIRL